MLMFKCSCEQLSTELRVLLLAEHMVLQLSLKLYM